MHAGGAASQDAGFNHHQNHLDRLERDIHLKYSMGKRRTLWNRKTGTVHQIKALLNA